MHLLNFIDMSNAFVSECSSVKECTAIFKFMASIVCKRLAGEGIHLREFVGENATFTRTFHLVFVEPPVVLEIESQTPNWRLLRLCKIDCEKDLRRYRRLLHLLANARIWLCEQLHLVFEVVKCTVATFAVSAVFSHVSHTNFWKHLQNSVKWVYTDTGFC